MREKLGCDAVLMQLPDRPRGGFPGRDRPDHAEGVSTSTAPTARRSATRRFRPSWPTRPHAARQHMLEALSMYSDELMELLLAEEDVPRDADPRRGRDGRGRAGVDAGVPGHGLSQQGRAAAVGRRRPLPALAAGRADARPWPTTTRTQEIPLDARSRQAVRGHGLQDRRRPVRPADVHADLPGQVRQGRARYFNQRTGRKERFSRIVRMHADQREEIDAAAAGDIVAVMGVDCASGDTYASRAQLLHAAEACSCPSR